MKTFKTPLCGIVFLLLLSATTQAAQPYGDLNEVQSNGVARGWAFDPDASSQSTLVHFYVDGPSGSGADAGTWTTDSPRPDVNGFYGVSGNHGFEFPIPERFRDGASHTLYAYAIDATGNPDTALPLKSFSLVSHLLYFGYYANAYTGFGDHPAIGGVDTTDYTLEIADHSNITWINGGDPAKLQEASSLGMKGVLDVTFIFFGSNDTLFNDYQERWNSYADSIQSNIQNVAAFYPLDEPFLQNGQPVSLADRDRIKANLETVISTIKQRFPQTPVAVFFGYRTVREDGGIPFVIPTGYDWVGFDCYGPFENCDGSGNSIPWYVSKVESKLTTQRMIMAPQGSYDSTNPTSQEEIVNRAGKYFTLAQSDSTFVGMFTFAYQSSGNVIGTRELSLVKNKYQQIGSSIVNYNNHRALNPIDNAQFFVRQHYLDILNREPDAGGLGYWTNEIMKCGSDSACVSQRRISVSHAFFDSGEFKQSNPDFANPNTTTYNGAFVNQCYFSYLRRQPEPDGYAFWTGTLNRQIPNSDYDSMIRAFIISIEYRARFGPV